VREAAFLRAPWYRYGHGRYCRGKNRFETQLVADRPGHVEITGIRAVWHRRPVWCRPDRKAGALRARSQKRLKDAAGFLMPGLRAGALRHGGRRRADMVAVLAVLLARAPVVRGPLVDPDQRFSRRCDRGYRPNRSLPASAMPLRKFAPSDHGVRRGRPGSPRSIVPRDRGAPPGNARRIRRSLAFKRQDRDGEQIVALHALTRP